MNLGSFLDNAADRYPNKTAVICGNKKITYRMLNSRADKLASSLYSLGMSKGSKAGILSFNRIEYIEAVFALMKLGAVCVPLHHKLTNVEITELAEHAEIKTIFFQKDLEEKVPSDAPFIRNYITFDTAKSHGAIAYESLLSKEDIRYPSGHISEDDEAVLIYTSGTTGRPKGVVLTHGNLISNTKNYTEAYGIIQSDIELAMTPLFHASTMGRVFTYVFNSVTFILCKRFSPEDALDIINKEKVTSITQAPTMYHMMLNVFKKGIWNTGSVTRVVTGASPMDLKAKRNLKELFPNAGFYDLYGLTEAGPGVTILSPPDFYRKIDSVGKPMKNVEIAVKDGKGNMVPGGHVGEIYCRGPNVMKGYHKDPEATSEVLRYGWLATGDMGRLDEEGFLYLSGRKKEIIISGGEKIYPGEVEKVISMHPAVDDVSVIGVPDEVWGEKVVAAVVVLQGNKCNEETILEFCKNQLAGFKCPRSVFFVSELSRTPSQKVLKAELRKIYENILNT